MSRYAVGVDLGGTKVEACLVDEQGAILARRRTPVEASQGQERVLDNILKIIDAAAASAAFEAVGMGTPGAYAPEDDIMQGTPHTPLYEQPGLVSRLRQRLGKPLIIENDANCLALAEYFENCRGTYSQVLAVILGTGVGAGLILDDCLYRGPLGNAGEIGHTTIAIEGRSCECGRRGCAEAYLSGPSHSRRYAERTGQTLDPAAIYARYQAGDEPARELFEESVRIMAELFANAVNMLDLQAIILGGGVSNIPLWYERVGPLLQRSLFGRRRTVPIIRATLGDSAGVLGAAYLGLREMGLKEF